jgi:trk system potassium uptake protein TrkA
MGCGRVGAALALALVKLGHEVAVIDRDTTAFHRLGADFPGQCVLGQGFDRDVLLRSGVKNADAFAAVSSGDNSNIISARVCKEIFDVPKVVARIYDYRRAQVYERLGIPTVTTVPWATERFLFALTEESEITSWRDPSGGVEVTALPRHEAWAGKAVKRFEEATGTRVVFLHRFGEAVLPSGKSILQAEDVVYVAVKVGDLPKAFTIALGEPKEDDS